MSFAMALLAAGILVLCPVIIMACVGVLVYHGVASWRKFLGN